MTAWTTTDHALMARALQLAERGAFTTKPNPMVGCVIARKDKIVGEGFHFRAGEPHAEVHALREAGERARGATAYVTLEPCGARSTGTASCAQRLVAASVTRVVYACEDPSPLASGQGSEQLIAAGIVVERGLLSQQAFEALGYGAWQGDVNSRLP